MNFIRTFIQKYSKVIVLVDIILIIFSIGFGNSGFVNAIVVFLLLLLLLFMPGKAFSDDNDNNTKDKK